MVICGDSVLGEDLVTRASWIGAPKFHIPLWERVGNEQTSLSGERRRERETDLESNLNRKIGLAVPKCPAKAVIFTSLSLVHGRRLSSDFNSVFS